MRKKLIAASLLLAVAAIAIIGLTIHYDHTHFTGYIFENAHVKYDNGFTSGERWVGTGTKAVYGIDELKTLAKGRKVMLTGLFEGPRGIAIELEEGARVLVVPGVGLESGIAETYGLF